MLSRNNKTLKKACCFLFSNNFYQRSRVPPAPASRWLLTPTGMLKMSHNGGSTDRRVRLYCNQGLTQAETALRLSIRDNIQISTRHLRRRRAWLKLYRRSHFSDAAGSDLNGQICVITNHTLTFDHVMIAHLIHYPVITGIRALFSHGNALNYYIITGKRAVILRLQTDSFMISR